MTRSELIAFIRHQKSYLCVGLDTDISKIPFHLLEEPDPVFAFNKAIIDATKEFCVAYKPNIAFYESLGLNGWISLQKTLDYIPSTHFTIADAKRGDIGNTSAMYAKTFFDTFSFDSVTVAPYMGNDSIQPFLDRKDKWTILLALTSNSGADDFEQLETKTGDRVYEQVLKKAIEWGDSNQLMFVAGATRVEELKRLRLLVPDHFLLIPGVGAQGGNLQEVSNAALTKDIGILVNASRSILYASVGEDFAQAAQGEAMKMQQEMQLILENYS